MGKRSEINNNVNVCRPVPDPQQQLISPEQAELCGRFITSAAAADHPGPPELGSFRSDQQEVGGPRFCCEAPV